MLILEFKLRASVMQRDPSRLHESQPKPDTTRQRSLGSPMALHLLCQAKRRARGYQTGCKPGLAGLVYGRIGAGALHSTVLVMFSCSGLC